MEEVTRNIISILRDTVTLLSDNFAGDGDDTDSGEVIQLGGALLDVLDQTAERVGTYDVRNVESEKGKAQDVIRCPNMTSNDKKQY